MLNSPQNKEKIIKAFPLLKSDKRFIIVDGPNPNFNCIAWAANVTYEWWSSLPLDKRPTIGLDGVKINWPFEVKDEFSVPVLVEIFKHIGYINCADCNYEEGFKKVAFYGNDNKATHAARQLTSKPYQGVWTSKLGRNETIHHETPYRLESKIYGEVKAFMKKSMK